MSWSLGLALWILLGLGVVWLVGEIAREFGGDSNDAIDREAERKRRIEERARRERWGGK